MTRPPVLRLHLDARELIIDSFAGGGGASTGIERATGRSPDIAVNHDSEALAMHAANHPATRHLQEDVWDVDPAKVCGGRPVGLAWFSPDCTYFSKARGAKPFRDRRRATRRRALACVIVRWAAAVRPRVICMENVEEWLDRGPLGADGMPDPERTGLSFRRWKRQLENLGYQVEHRELRACDYGAPTSRKRLFVVARCDGRAIVWPSPSHGPSRPLPHRTAAECIDWSIPVPSIFGRKRPLAENTLRRIARGIDKYVMRSARPFVVPLTHHGDRRVHPLDEPLPTVTGAHRGEFALVAPYVQRDFGQSIGSDMCEPLPTITAGANGHCALVAPYMVNTRNGEREGQAPRVFDPLAPYPTVTAQGSQGGLVAAFLARHFGGDRPPNGADFRSPLPTVTSVDHHAVVTAQLGMFGAAPAPWRVDEVRAFLITYYGTEQAPEMQLPLATITTKDRFGLVTVAGCEYRIVDIGMRMLVARELFTAQDFPSEYVIDPWMPAHTRHDSDGDVWVKDGPLCGTSQVRMCGNSVSPAVAAALVAANLAEQAADAAGMVA